MYLSLCRGLSELTAPIATIAPRINLHAFNIACLSCEVNFRMKRTRPWKVPACYDGTRSSWQAEGTGTRAMYQARQRRMERKAERLQDCPLGDATLRALPAACRSARTVQHDGAGPAALLSLLQQCGAWEKAQGFLADVCASGHPLRASLRGWKGAPAPSR